MASSSVHPGADYVARTAQPSESTRRNREPYAAASPEPVVHRDISHGTRPGVMGD